MRSAWVASPSREHNLDQKWVRSDRKPQTRAAPTTAGTWVDGSYWRVRASRPWLGRVFRLHDYSAYRLESATSGGTLLVETVQAWVAPLAATLTAIVGIFDGCQHLLPHLADQP